MQRDIVHYSVGNERSPTDPFGRSHLVIHVDGSARLDQYTRAGQVSWTGKVVPSALDDFWRALEEAGFPSFPHHPVPAGSAIRHLNVGGPDGKSAYIAYHAAENIPGYRSAFRILDTVIRQLSDDTVKVVPDGAATIVESIVVVSADRDR